MGESHSDKEKRMPEDNVVPLPVKTDPFAALNDLEEALGMDSTEWEDQ